MASVDIISCMYKLTDLIHKLTHGCAVLCNSVHNIYVTTRELTEGKKL